MNAVLYEPAQTAWYDAIEPYHRPPTSMPTPQTVLDLGSNYGSTMRDYRRLWPNARIVGVEMNRDYIWYVQRLAPGCELRTHAIRSTPGIGFYFTHENPAAYRLGEQIDGTRAVECFTLEETILDTFGGPVDFVKMDIEGEEWDVIEHGFGWRPLVHHILVEFHGPGETLLDDPANPAILARGLRALNGLGYVARHHPPHPTAVYAYR